MNFKKLSTGCREALAVTAFLAVAALAIFHTTEARGDLTAKVYPGYTFQSGQRVTVEQLNRLGVPTIVIVGTLDGTNVGLSAGSVNGTMLSADVVDNVTTSFTNQSIRVKPGGIRNLQLYTNMFDLLSGLDPGGTTIRVKYDGTFVVLSNNALTIDTNNVGIAVSKTLTNILPNQIALADGSMIVGGPMGTGTVVNVSTYLNSITYSNTVAVPGAGNAQSVSPGLGNYPSWIRVTLLCVTTDTATAYTAGMELEIASVQAASNEPAFAVFLGGDGSLQIRRNQAAGSRLKLIKQTNGALTETTSDANFVLCIRARK